MSAICRVAVAADHPELVQPLNWLVRRAELAAVLPGIYAAAQQARDRDVRVRAVMLAAPDAVLVGPAAAYVSSWPKVPKRFTGSC